MNYFVNVLNIDGMVYIFKQYLHYFVLPFTLKTQSMILCQPNLKFF
jgi:hypothetical protein